MNQSFFIHNSGEGETSIMSSRKEDGKGFLIASHPPFSLSTKPYGNSDRGFPTCFLPLCSFSGIQGSFTLSDYISAYWDGCGRYCISQSPHKAASPILPLGLSDSDCNKKCNSYGKKENIGLLQKSPYYYIN